MNLFIRCLTFTPEFERLRLYCVEHVAHARASATHAAAAVMDSANAAAYQYLPFFYSRVFEHGGSERKVSWVFYGLQGGNEVVVVGDFAPKLGAFWVDGGKVVGLMLESGSNEENAAVAAAAAAQPSVDVAALKACATVEEALALVASA